MARLGTSAKVTLALGLVALLALGQQAGMWRAAAQEDQLLTREQALQAINGPVFLDAYWVDRNSSSDSAAPARKEVGPGDGTSTLAVVMVNRGTSDITAVRGTLTLPDGFSAYGTGGPVTTAQATYNQLVTAGSTFTLYFDLDVSGNAKVGSYTGQLSVEYSKIRETGSFRQDATPVPFRLTGKVILDPVALTRNLVPGVSNEVQIAIRNGGTAPATGVVVTITGININGGTNSGSNSDSASTLRPQITSFGTNTFTLGTISPGGNATMTTSLFPNIATGGNAAGIQLDITYNDANGNTRTLSPSVGVVVLQNAPSVIGVTAGSGGNATADNRIVAGKTDDFFLEISNKGAVPITSVVVTMESPSSSLNILGDSKWAVDRIDPQSNAQLKTQVFAATSLIGNPSTFDVTIDYLLDGSPKTEKYVLGTYIDGEIALSVYDMTINYVGATPTLVGNILNEGNTAALFTKIELVGQEGADGQAGSPTIGNQTFGQGFNRNFTRPAPPSPQYLGDITANSPLPFSMPLTARFDPAQSTYPVTVRITYKDSLRNEHELLVKGTASFVQQTAGTAGFNSGFTGQQRFQRQDFGLVPIIAIAAAAAAGVVIYLAFRRRRTRAAKSVAGNGQDKRENIEDILENPHGEGLGKDRPAK